MDKIETIKLDNGLTIYFYTDNKRHSTFFQFVTLYGGKTKDFIVDGNTYHMQDGIAHILEHYIVEENKYGNFLKSLGEKQMSTNAYTYYDMTRYYFEAVEDIEYGIRTLIRGIYAPVFEEERLEKVKKPILQEIRGRYDNKFYHANMETLNNLFSKIKVRSIGGSLDDVSQTTLEDIKLCYKTFYQPKNQFIVVGGNFDKDKILNTIKEVYEEIDIEEKDFEVIKVLEDDNIVKEKGIIKFPTAEEYTEVSFKINTSKFNTEEKLRLDFYLHYFFDMFFGIYSPLYRELVNDKIITTSLSCSDIQFDDYMIVSIGSYSNNPRELERRILDTINNMNSFDEELFDINKKDSILKIVLRSEHLMDTIMPFVNNIVYFNYPYPDTVSDIEKFNYDEFTEMIKSLDFSNYTITTIEN